MSESIEGLAAEEVNARRSALMQKFSPQIWDFLFSDARQTYYLHGAELVADTSESTRQLISKREIVLDDDEAAVVRYYRNEAEDEIAKRFIADLQLQKLIGLEGIYSKHILSLSPLESHVRLGAISTGAIPPQQEATILIPQRFEDFLNLRNAAATLERAVGEIIEEPYSMILKVPGLLAVSAIAEYLENSRTEVPQSGMYL